MMQDKPEWDEQRVLNVFNAEDAQNILLCPIAPTCEEMALWERHMTGAYSTHSGYNWFLKRNSIQQEHPRIWHRIAKLKTLPKIKSFAWRACHEALPTGKRLLEVGLGDSVCRLCTQDIETTVHALRDCLRVKEILELSGVSSRIHNGGHMSLKEWFEDAFPKMHITQFTTMVVLLWNVESREQDGA
ncbi:hypothetical protein like AT3G09510 [Hibiscus trionum]|uniref:Reverse transcriptase zinc-binding domain-containing protein n=1 Tax=Hibiscus trionum TaxID=183268 RepID=A0A9W7LI42_HIBTR|nr:hypothetical protein like AT3G09510 [Hibiscus trionum]